MGCVPQADRWREQVWKGRGQPVGGFPHPSEGFGLESPELGPVLEQTRRPPGSHADVVGV